MPPRSRTKVAAPEPAEAAEEVSNGLRPAGLLHQSMADWYNEEFADELDAELTPRQVQIVIAKRNAYRKSPAYEEYLEKKENEADAEEEETPAPRKRSAKAAPAEEAEAPRPRGRRGGRALKAVDSESAAEDAPVPAPRGRRARATKAATADAPF
jgi:hypothetical protein